MHSRVNDVQINANLALMTVLYVAGFALIGVSCADWLADQWGDLGIALVIAGAVRTTAGWFCALERRERNAFELGRDYEIQREIERFTG